MIKFVIDKIHLRNVRNYGDEGMDMDFPVGNLTVFTGHVGAGKSTILKSVSMALYGDDGGVKGEKLSIDDMVNERSGKNLEIELYFHSVDTLDNNREDQYEIHLYHKHSKHQNKLVFIKNGIDISANGKMDTYRLIEKTLIPKDVYHNIYYFTQQAKNFFTALPNSEQKAIFDSILDLSDYDKYYQNCRQNITEYENLIEKCVLEVNLLKSSVEEKQRLIEKETENIEALKKSNEEELEKLKKEGSELFTQLELLKSQLDIFDIHDLEDQLSKLESEQALTQTKYDHEIELLEQKVTEVKNSIQSEFNDAKLKAKEKLDPVVKALEDQVNGKKQEKLILEKNLSDETAKINQSRCVKEMSIKDKYDKKLSDLSVEIAQLNGQITSKKAEADKEATEIKSKAAELKAKRDKDLASVNNEIQTETTNQIRIADDIDKRVTIISANTRELKSEHPHCDKCGQALVNLDHLVTENDKLTQEVDGLNKQKSESEKKVCDLRAKSNEITNTCEAELNTLRDKFKTIASVYNETKAKIETQLSEKKSELDNVSANKKAELDQVSLETDAKLDAVNAEFKQKTAKVDEEITSLQSDIELETSKAKQELIELSKTLSKKQSLALSEIDESITTKRKEKAIKYEEANASITKLRAEKLDRQTADTKISNIESEIKEKAVQIKLKTTYKPSEDTLKNLVESKQHDEDALKVQVKRHDDLKETLAILEFWKTAFSDSGIKSMLIDVAIPHMNRCVREELDIVFAKLKENGFANKKCTIT